MDLEHPLDSIPTGIAELDYSYLARLLSLMLRYGVVIIMLFSKYAIELRFL